MGSFHFHFILSLWRAVCIFNTSAWTITDILNFCIYRRNQISAFAVWTIHAVICSSVFCDIYLLIHFADESKFGILKYFFNNISIDMTTSSLTILSYLNTSSKSIIAPPVFGSSLPGLPYSSSCMLSSSSVISLLSSPA